MEKVLRAWLAVPLFLLSCVDKGGTHAPTQGADRLPDESPVCASCRAGGETADFGASPGTTCASVEAPLTEEVERAYELKQLRAFLATPRVVMAEPHAVPPGQPALEGPIAIKFTFEVGPFRYRTGERCNSVWAPVKLSAEVGDGLLSFSASGSMYKQENALHAFMYTSADLASATGSYRPVVDTSRPHIGEIEVPIYVYSDQLRGSVLPALLYFQGEEQLTSYLQHAPASTPGLAGLPKFETLVHLDFPVDDCLDTDLLLAADSTSELLAGQGLAQLRRDVFERIATVTSLPAVWKDGSQTMVRVELSSISDGAACASVNDVPDPRVSDGPELQLTMPAEARVRSDDGKLDAALDQLSIVLDRKSGALRSASLRFYPDLPGQPRIASINYSFANGTVSADGIAQFLIEVTPGGGTNGDCVAFPPGGKADTDQCRYMRQP